MRKFPQAGGAVIGALAVTAGVLAAAPAAGHPPRATARAAVTSRADISPGRPMALVRGRSTAALREGPANRTESVNWAGYAATNPPGAFRYVQATFFVPYVSCVSTPGSDASHWVGFDGVGDATVEQIGVLSACQGKIATYSAWYEMYPKFPVYLRMAIQPGNAIVASVYYNDHSRRFRLSLTDTTSGRRFSRSLACPSRVRCRRSSAEVITEAPTAGTKIMPLTDFGAQGYSGVRVTDQAGYRAGMRGRKWDTTAVTMVSMTGGHILDQPTAIYHGRTFGNYWQRAG